MKNILFVSPHVDMYGATRSMMTYVLYLKAIGCNPILIIPSPGEIETILQKNSVDYIIIKYYNWINNRLYIKKLMKYFLNYLSAVKVMFILRSKQLKADLVHSNSIVSPFAIQLSDVLKVKFIQHIREFGLLDFDMKFNFPDHFVKRKLNSCSYAICISNSVRKYYLNYIDKEKLITIYNGINVPEVCKKYNSSETLRILLVGRLSSEKGQAHVINAIYELVKDSYKKIKLDIYGEGKDEKKLDNYIEQLDVKEYVQLKGYSDSVNYDNYDIGIMSSKMEGFGRVTVEYMAHGLPVIGTRTGATPEIIIENENGLLYTPGNITELKNCILFFYEHKERIKIMGIKAWKHSRENFSSDNYNAKIYNVYKKIGLK